MAVLSAKAKVSAAANGFRRLAANLAKVADGAAVEVVLNRVAAQMNGVARDKVAAHRASGHAASDTLAKRDGKGVELAFPKYLDFHPGWWPFAKGLPLFIVTGAASMLRRVVAATIESGDPNAASAYFEAQDEAAEQKQRKRDERDDERIRRREEREERAADRKAKSDQRKSDAQARRDEKLNARIKAREDRE